MNLAQQLQQTLIFLQERRKGYRYSISLSVKADKWTCSVVGESLEDKSYPHDFVSCSTEDFDSLPFLIKQKAIDLLKLEQQKNEERIKELQKSNEKLVAEHTLISNLKL